VCHVPEATEREGGNIEMVPARERVSNVVETTGAGVMGSMGGGRRAGVEYVGHLQVLAVAALCC
jgi:hypothetical protein